MNLVEEITVPQESVNDESLLVLELNVKSGDWVEAGSPLVELETSKTTFSVEASKAGYVKLFCKPGDNLPVNGLIAKIFDSEPSSPPNVLPSTSQQNVAIDPGEINVKETIFSEEAQRYLFQVGLQKDAFLGQDFVSKKDVLKFLGKPVTSGYTYAEAKRTLNVSSQNTNPSVDFRKIESIKAKEIQYLSSVQSTGLVSTVYTWVETAKVLEYANQYLQIFKNSVLPLAIFECSKLLMKYPNFNCYFDDNRIGFYKNINVGFAVDIDKGLKVLNIRDTPSKSILEIEEKLLQLSNDYLDDAITPDSLADTTFTVTDLSGEGVFSFTPLVNFKNAAILGISSMDPKLNRSLFALSFDHRINAGRAAAIFLRELKDRVESYTSQQVYRAWADRELEYITCYKCLKKLSQDFSEVGFARCVTPNGSDGYICQSCFKGY